MSLTPNEISRYQQQLKLEQIGLAGQLKLKNARVLCIGAGGLGSVALFYLAAAGIGNIGIVDDDVIEMSNLQRQILYQQQYVGYKKVVIAQQQLLALNPDIVINAYVARLSLENAQKVIAQYDIVMDCSDNFPTRYLVNDVCFYLNKPYVFAGVSRFKGQCSFFIGNNQPCLRCLFPTVSEQNTLFDCASEGVLGVLPGLLGTIQATEVIKWLLQLGDNLIGRLLSVDALSMQFQQFVFAQNPHCELCVQKKPITSLSKIAACYDFPKDSITVDQLREKLSRENEIVLLDVRTMTERLTYDLGGIFIPIAELSSRLAELDPESEIVVYCHSDVRSKQAVKILLAESFSKVRYLEGGVMEWQKVTNNFA